MVSGPPSTPTSSCSSPLSAWPISCCLASVTVHLLERLLAVPDAAWSPVATGAQILIVGGIGLLAGSPLIFTSLGPTAFMHAELPHHRSSRFYNTVAGHVLAMGSGFFAVWALDAWSAPAVESSRQITAVRVWAAVVAIVLTALLTLALKANHPPAVATTLLVALGPFDQARDAVTLFVGVVIVAIVGEVFRRLRALRKSRLAQPFAPHPPL